MSSDQPKPCPKHPDRFLSRKHAIQCLDMHQGLQISTIIGDPLSFLLSSLSTRKPRSYQSVSSWFFR